MPRLFRNFVRTVLVIAGLLIGQRLDAQSACGGRADAVDFMYDTDTWHDWASGADFWTDPMGWCQPDHWTGGWGYTGHEWDWMFFADFFDDHTPQGYDLAYIPPSPIQCAANQRPAMLVRSDGWIANAWCEELPREPHTLMQFEIDSWFEVVGMFFNFAIGAGPDTTTFRAGTIQVYQMQQAPGVQGAINYWYEKNADRIAYSDCTGLLPVHDYDARFGLKGLHDAGGNATQQFVGSYKVDIDPHPDGSGTITIFNITSMSSLLEDLGPDWSRATFPLGGNQSQYYTWEQQLCTPAW